MRELTTIHLVQRVLLFNFIQECGIHLKNLNKINQDDSGLNYYGKDLIMRSGEENSLNASLSRYVLIL